MFKIVGFLTLSLLVFLPSTYGMNYSGIVVKATSKSYRIKEQRLGKTFDLTHESPQIAAALRKLSVNDFVSFEGARNSLTASIRVDSINYVGLTKLLATWVGNDNYCYRFATFNDLEIFPLIGKKCFEPLMTSRKYAYTISPSEYDWLLLLSDNQANYVADLSLKNQNSVQMSLYDSNTGDILREIKLRK